MKTVIRVLGIVDTSPISALRNGGGRRGSGVVATEGSVESLRGLMGAAQSTRQVEGLFESLLAEAFHG